MTTVNRVLMTIVENEDYNASEEEMGAGRWFRRVEIEMYEGEYKSEAFSINKDTKERVFRGCCVLASYDESYEKAREFVEYEEAYFF